jgi:hypothetical protein
VHQKNIQSALQEQDGRLSNASDIMSTVFIGIYFYFYFHLNCSTKPFLYSIIVNIFTVISIILCRILSNSEISVLIMKGLMMAVNRREEVTRPTVYVLCKAVS